MDENAATGRQQLATSTETLASPSSLHAPLPTIPFDLIPEILCRLSVKLLVQLKCVCKSWNSLISNLKFAKKHLCMSTACLDQHHLIVASWSTSHKSLPWIPHRSSLYYSTISSILSDVLSNSNSTVPQLLGYPETPFYDGRPVVVSSCDDILLFDIDLRFPLLWNPSIRKFKILPPLLKPSTGRIIYTFGYDHFIDNYKIFATSCIHESGVDVNQWKNEVIVYTLGYYSWRRIDEFPCDGRIFGPGIFVSGTVNWLTFDVLGLLGYHASGVVSLDLEKESYRKLLIPDLNKSQLSFVKSTLGVLMNCLCIFTNSDEFLDVWVMKEYGIKESWTKLFSIPYVGGGPRSFYLTKVVYVYEDDLVLLDYKEWKLVVYNSRNGTFKIPKIQSISRSMVPEVYVESLISPWC